MPNFTILLEDVLFAISFLLFSIAIGIVGYRLFAGFGWFKSFYNSCVILSGTGSPDLVPTRPGQAFEAIYALYGGVVFLIIIAIIIGRAAVAIGS